MEYFGLNLSQIKWLWNPAQENNEFKYRFKIVFFCQTCFFHAGKKYTQTNTCIIKYLCCIPFSIIQVYKRDELEVVANLCKKHDVIVIADEVYEWMIFKGHKHIKIGECRSCLPLIKLLNIFTRRMDCTEKTLISWTPSTTKARLYTKHGLKLSQILLF